MTLRGPDVGTREALLACSLAVLACHGASGTTTLDTDTTATAEAFAAGHDTVNTVICNNLGAPEMCPC